MRLLFVREVCVLRFVVDSFLVRHWFGTVPFILLVPSFFRKKTKTKSTMADPARNPPSSKRAKLNKLPTSVSTVEAAQTVPPPNANPQQPQFVHYPLPTQQQQQQQNVVAPTPSSTPPNQLLHQQAQQMQQLPQVRLQSAVPSVVVTQSQYQVRSGDVWPFFDSHTATTLQTTHTHTHPIRCFQNAALPEFLSCPSVHVLPSALLFRIIGAGHQCFSLRRLLVECRSQCKENVGQQTTPHTHTHNQQKGA